MRKRIAPVNVLRRDFEILRSMDKLQTSNEVQDIVFMQSIEGRAHTGVGAFNKRYFVNTTIDDVVKAMNRDPEKVKQFRQQLIDEVIAFVHSVINGEKRDRLINAHGEPFLRSPLFQERRVNGRDVLRGLYLGGLRDNAEIRKQTESKYRITIGCGECYMVNTRVMAEMELDGELLAHEPHEHEIDEFKRRGLIVEGEKDDASDDELCYFYIRHRLGPGQSDDAAIIISGLLYNVDVAIGVFLSDAIDTLEKYAPRYSDQDQEIAYLIGRAFQDLKITVEDVYELCYLCTIPVAEEELYCDSSMRYLLSLDPQMSISAIESHLNFVEGKPLVKIPISYKRATNLPFYELLRKKLLNVRRMSNLAIPTVSHKEWNQPVKALAKNNFIIAKSDEPLAQVVRRLREAKAELIVVLNDSNKVLGTVSVADLIHLTT